VMLCAAGIAIATMNRLAVNPFDNASDGSADPRPLFGLGERAIGFVRRHPLVSCTVVAGLSAPPAMSHAETTVAGALPYGVIQAATVVMGFILLGPALGLRRPNRARTSR
jgi:hypothetical protein